MHVPKRFPHKTPRNVHSGLRTWSIGGLLTTIVDSETWLGFIRKERDLACALLTRKIKLRGDPRLLVAFGKCFPS